MSAVWRILLVDDEPLARLRLRSLLQTPDAAGSVELVEAGNATDALAALAPTGGQGFDLVLLDIGLPGSDGLKIAQAIGRLPAPPAVVFVTAHAEHALQAFELEAVDYLTKPVKRERLQAALQRVAQRLALRSGQAAAAPEPDGMLVVSDRGRVVRVPLAEVLYLKAELKYVTLRTAQHSYVLDDSLADLESRLGERFLRVHRNALVSRVAVRALERRTLVGEGSYDGSEGGSESGEAWAVRVAPVDEWLAVSRRQLAAVREALTAAGP